MRYLITGGAGFIGSHLADALLEAGHDVRVLDDFSTGRRSNLEFAIATRRIKIVEGDVREPGIVRQVVDGVDGIFHLAALVSVPQSIEDPQRSFDINACGTVNVLEAARQTRIPRVMLASSAAVYGDAPAPAQEDAVPRPLSPYALDKLVAEQYAAQYCHLYGMQTTALRLFNVYGPRQDPASAYSGVISVFADRIRQGKAVSVYGDGEQTRDFVHVSDVVQAATLAMQAGPPGFAAYNVGAGRAVSINSLVEILSAIAAGRPRIVHQPARDGEVRHSRADISRIQRALGYRPRCDLESGLRDLARSIA